MQHVHILLNEVRIVEKASIEVIKLDLNDVVTVTSNCPTDTTGTPTCTKRVRT